MQTNAVLFGIVGHVLLERILVAWEAGDRPVQRRHVHLVDGLRVSGGEHADGAAVEGALERQYRVVRTRRTLVHHAVLHLLRRPRRFFAIELAAPNEHGLVGFTYT